MNPVDTTPQKVSRKEVALWTIIMLSISMWLWWSHETTNMNIAQASGEGIVETISEVDSPFQCNNQTDSLEWDLDSCS